MSDILDLDALAPKQVTIKIGDKEIQMQPPKTGRVLALGGLAQKLQDANKLPPDEVDNLVDELTSLVYQCIPEINGTPLNTAQLLKLVQIISEQSIPPDAKELQKRGITVDSPKAQQG